VPAVEDDCDVDVDDVTVLQRPLARYAVADDMVDRGAAAAGEAAIAERGRNAASGDHLGMDDLVYLAGGDTGHDVRDERVEHLGGGTAGAPHAFEPLGPVQLDRPASSENFGIGDGQIFGHGADIGPKPRLGEGPGPA
jgi:hypothetical protein